MTVHPTALQLNLAGPGTSFSNLRWTLMFGNPSQRKLAGAKLAEIGTIPTCSSQAAQTKKEADAVRRAVSRR